MKGNITIKVSDRGYAIDMDLDEVCLQDKCELMHSLLVALEMDEEEKAIYFRAEYLGVLEDAHTVRTYETPEELDRLLRGGKV